jgi:hypothetical protein
LGSIFGAARKNCQCEIFQDAIESTYACWRLIEIDSIVVVGNGLGGRFKSISLKCRNRFVGKPYPSPGAV